MIEHPPQRATEQVGPVLRVTIPNKVRHLGGPASFDCKISFVRELPLADPRAQAERDGQWHDFALRLAGLSRSA